MLGDELRAVLHVLAAHDIPAMPYKGVALAAQLYGDAGLRVSGDIDVIVPAAQRQAAVHALQEVRGSTRRSTPSTPPGKSSSTCATFTTTTLCTTRPVMVEVHWDATGRADGFAPDWPGIWARSTAGTWQGAPAWLPSPDDLFLLLALHGSKHQWTVLKWLVDVGALLEQAPALDWSLFESRAEQWGISRSLVLTRFLSAQLLGISLRGRGDIAPGTPGDRADRGRAGAGHDGQSSLHHATARTAWHSVYVTSDTFCSPSTSRICTRSRRRCRPRICAAALADSAQAQCSLPRPPGRVTWCAEPWPNRRRLQPVDGNGGVRWRRRAGATSGYVASAILSTRSV
ncbi:MAG: nucleotidyltransferase family protein [Caldilineaceae bacterium]